MEEISHRFGSRRKRNTGERLSIISPPVRRDIPRALANHALSRLWHVDFARNSVFRAKNLGIHRLSYKAGIKT